MRSQCALLIRAGSALIDSKRKEMGGKVPPNRVLLAPKQYSFAEVDVS
jgi:hypothetical protein